MAMKPKTEEVNGKQYAVLDDQGRVLYDNDGKEFAFDAEQTYNKITELQGEAKQHREAKEAAESEKQKLEKQIGDVDLSKMVNQDKLEEVKSEVAKSYESSLEEERNARQALEQRYNTEKLQSSFASSQFVNENLAVPPDMAMATFGQNFEVQDGQLVPKDQQGNVIYSRKNPGSVADFDEAMSQIVEGYQYKDRIMKASNHQGTGGEGGQGQAPAKTISRSEFEGMNPQQQQEVASSIKEGKAEIVDG